MSPAGTIERGPVVAALGSVWTSLAELGGSLVPQDWDRPTELAGWSVRDVLAHVLGTEAMLEGQPTPPGPPDPGQLEHVRNDIGALNEAWVISARSLTPPQLLERFRQVTSRRLQALEAMSQEEFDADSWTPAGPATYGRFMQIRVYDCWVHEQDIRQALSRPGHESGPAAEQSLDEVVRALGYIVGKKAGAPSGSSVTFALSGPAARTIHVEVSDRARVVDRLPGPATVVLDLPAGLFLRLAAGRTEADQHRAEVTVQGDETLGQQVLGALNFTV